jgi:uncharacterized protein
VRFWDASAIVPLCVVEGRSAALRRLLEQDAAIAAWWGTPIECCSAFARLRRDGVVTRTEEGHARSVVAALAREWTEVNPTEPVRDQAARLLLRHPLRAADALQLAAGLVWAGAAPSGSPFVALDDRLRTAALEEGVSLLPPD